MMMPYILIAVLAAVTLTHVWKQKAQHKTHQWFLEQHCKKAMQTDVEVRQLKENIQSLLETVEQDVDNQTSMLKVQEQIMTEIDRIRASCMSAAKSRDGLIRVQSVTTSELKSQLERIYVLETSRHA